MDLFWLVVVLFSWRVLTREYWRTQIVPADPHIWSWLGQRLPERALLAIYRATFFYGVCRLLAWTGWAHVFATPGDRRREATSATRSTCRGRVRGGSTRDRSRTCRWSSCSR